MLHNLHLACTKQPSGVSILMLTPLSCLWYYPFCLENNFPIWFNHCCMQALWVWSTDKHQRSQTSYTTLCNGVISHAAQFGGLQVFADHTRKTNMFTIFVRRVAFCAWLSSCSDRGTYAPDEPWLFWLQEKPEDPQIEPRARIKMAQGLVYLWYDQINSSDCCKWLLKIVCYKWDSCVRSAREDLRRAWKACQKKDKLLWFVQVYYFHVFMTAKSQVLCKSHKMTAVYYYNIIICFKNSE